MSVWPPHAVRPLPYTERALKTPCSTTERGPWGLWLEGGDRNEARPDSGEALTAPTSAETLQQSESRRRGPLGWEVGCCGMEPLEFGGSPSALAPFRFPKSKVLGDFFSHVIQSILFFGKVMEYDLRPREVQSLMGHGTQFVYTIRFGFSAESWNRNKPSRGPAY